MRAGGAGKYTAEQFDEEADFLAANVSAGIGATSGSASVNFLAKDVDQALDLFFAMLREPAFQQDRLDLYKTQVLQGLERRNDNTAGIEGREFARLMYGDVALLDDAADQGVGGRHHARRPRGLPQAVVPPGELHLRGVRRRRARATIDREARAAHGRLDGPAKFAVPPVPKPTARARRPASTSWTSPT